MPGYDPAVVAAVITASVTLAGAMLTIVYSFFHERAENKRHARQLTVEEQKAKLEQKRLELELDNQRQIKIFEARLESYPKLYEDLMALEKRALPHLTKEKALQIEANLRECAYVDVSHCLSAKALEALIDLRDSLISFAKQETGLDLLRKKRTALLQALHQDLGREGEYLGPYLPLREVDKVRLQTGVDSSH